jgi:hypothetical protein
MPVGLSNVLIHATRIYLRNETRVLTMLLGRERDVVWWMGLDDIILPT